MKDYFLDLKIEVILEPGRYLVGSSGLLLVKLLELKKVKTRIFLIIDCGMNNLIRPSLYNSIHQIIPVNKQIKGGMNMILSDQFVKLVIFL